MNRLNLRIYNPLEEPVAVEADEPEVDRDIIPFRPQNRTTVISGRYAPPVDRARLIHDNSVCPECSRCNVEPLELQDALISPRNRLPVPGTATIVGFHCNDCGSEWPVYELTRRNG
ncbi:MAG: hypothetical protein KDA81_07685 [Planctomycetaceae bacterium]|nr:hypothetical protein [Planctomycetaceae bacterium]